jgi:hypothetical protein
LENRKKRNRAEIKNPIRLVLADVDGTLLTQGKVFTEKTKEVAAKLGKSGNLRPLRLKRTCLPDTRCQNQGADHLCFVKVRIRLWDDRSDDSFPGIIVGYANNRTFHDPLHFVEITFNFFRVYVVAAGDDQILAAPEQGQISLR